MEKFTCPWCGKELINISDDDTYKFFWCDDCNSEIYITKQGNSLVIDGTEEK